MERRVALPLILVVTLVVLGYALGAVRWKPPNIWSTEFGASGGGNRVQSLSADSGGLYAGGFVGSGVNASKSQFFVSRYDLSHRQVWFRGVELFGKPGSGEGWLAEVAGATDGVYIVGPMNHAGYIQKYDMQGNVAWTGQLGFSPYSLSVGEIGVYVAGFTFSSNNSYAPMLQGFDPGGSELLTELIGSYSTGPGFISVFAGTNGLYVSGWPAGSDTSKVDSFVRRYDFNGTLQWNRQLTCTCLPREVSGDATGIYVTGNKPRLLGSASFVAKYDLDAHHLWMIWPPYYAPQISADPSGLYMASGTGPRGGGLVYLAKYDGRGNRVWSFQIPSTKPMSLYSLSVGPSSVYVGGEAVNQEVGFVSEFSQSSSLFFFELNPPLSFLTIGLLIAAASISTAWLQRMANRIPRSRSQGNLQSNMR